MSVVLDNVQGPPHLACFSVVSEATHEASPEPLKILEVLKLGKSSKANLGPFWPHVAKVWPNKIVSGNPQG